MSDTKKHFLQSFILLITTITFVAQGMPAYAQDGTPVPSDDEINAIARKLYCPVCENIPLDVCATQACGQWRDLIREKIIQGWTQEQIISYFAEQYGDRVLAAPPVRDALSLNILAYVIPPLAFLAGIYIVIQYLRKKKIDVLSEHVTEPASLDHDREDEYMNRIEEEIRRNS